MSRKAKLPDFTASNGLDVWKKYCGFLTWEDALKSLQIDGHPSERSVYRWRVLGLPSGIAGELILQRMCEIARQRTSKG